MTHTPSKRLGKKQWQALIYEQQNSSVSQSEFCRSKGLCLATFYNWKRKLNPTENSITEASSQWIELPAPQQTWDIELELPGNIILRMRQ
ncbi:MAG: IS66 family insertion sequence element accessory protein TnpA [Endozoicomonas sp.]|uniref:IS66 family insertion sequence element accessory protein TnpA n=1 Tax=Endozoicomonas sp. TaxID=1892382 RepID=UPI003D9B9DF1